MSGEFWLGALAGASVVVSAFIIARASAALMAGGGRQGRYGDE